MTLELLRTASDRAYWMMDSSSFALLASRLVLTTPMNEGAAMAARMPTMAMVTISSTTVNPE